jgi:alanyl-tRNA synthetase
MTERLYYHDSSLREFDARVLSCEREGERWKVVLDRTAFYPTSGGQPHDLGTLNGVQVIEVADGEENKVVHYTTAEIPAGAVALLGSRETGHVVFAQSKGLAHDMGAVLRDSLKEFGGKGGGPKDFAQGSVPDATKVDAVLARAKGLLGA